MEAGGKDVDCRVERRGRGTAASGNTESGVARHLATTARKGRQDATARSEKQETRSQ